MFAPLEADGETALRSVLDQVAAFHRAVRENAERVVAVRSRADLDPVEAGERIGLMLSMEGAEALGSDPRAVAAFHELGVRMVSLTWNRANAWAGGASVDSGLTPLGAELVDRLVELGIVVDLVHASERTFWDVLERAEGGTSSSATPPAGRSSTIRATSPTTSCAPSRSVAACSA